MRDGKYVVRLMSDKNTYYVRRAGMSKHINYKRSNKC